MQFEYSVSIFYIKYIAEIFTIFDLVFLRYTYFKKIGKQSLALVARVFWLYAHRFALDLAKPFSRSRILYNTTQNQNARHTFIFSRFSYLRSVDPRMTLDALCIVQAYLCLSCDIASICNILGEI